MNRILVAKQCDFVAVPNIDWLIEDSWWNDVDHSKFGGYRAYHSTVNSILTSGPRVEGYLMEDGYPVAMVFMQRSMDIHYGLVATPMLTYIHTKYRSNRKVVRALSNLVKDAVRKLDCEQYYVVKHPDRTKAIHTIRSL